jgi:hypothetical protein
MDRFREIFDSSSLVNQKANSVLSGLISIYLLFNCFNIVLDGNITWSIYSILALVLVFIPPIYLEDRSALVPFEVLILLAVPFTLKGVELGFVASHTLNYVSAAAVALLLVTELDTFTELRTNSVFSVLLVSLTTLATAGAWALGRWLSDMYLGTGFIQSEAALMWEFSAALLAGIVAGLFFRYYLKKRTDEVFSQ